jgi:hypothetical protein
MATTMTTGRRVGGASGGWPAQFGGDAPGLGGPNDDIGLLSGVEPVDVAAVSDGPGRGRPADVPRRGGPNPRVGRGLAKYSTGAAASTRIVIGRD